MSQSMNLKVQDIDRWKPKVPRRPSLESGGYCAIAWLYYILNPGRLWV